MFIRRLITVIILVPLVIWLILGTTVAVFQIFSAVFCLLAAWEWASLMGMSNNFNKAVYVILLLGGLSIVQFIPYIYVLWLAVIWWLIAIIILWGYVRKQAYTKKVFINGAIGFLCIVPAWVGLNSLRAGPDGAQYVILFLFLLWATDTGAYLVGMRYGKKKLAPTLSPGKTMEGVIGGFVLMLVFLFIGLFVFKISSDKWLGLAILAVVMVFFSIIGDLFESLFKRIAKVKDSGHMIPGHGGILDRLDSLLAAAPIFALGLILFGIR